MTHRVRRAGIEEPGVLHLVSRHVALMRAQTPPESAHAMPAEALARSEAVILAVENDAGVVIGIGALARLSHDHGEIKSMHTAQDARGAGVARTILHALIETARAQGLTRLSLETGSADAFAPARDLYLSEGFAYGPPFGDYVVDPLSVFMTRTV